jgi:ubiquinone/menaquinone biosynthesis C-methylase UbiE
MTKLTDQHYLKTQQYRSASNLEARIALHRDFGANPYDWQLWVFDQLDLQPGMQVLEMGCGPASLWRENLIGPQARPVPQGIRFFLGDLSTGMVGQARINLAGVPQENHRSQPRFAYLAGDVQTLPFPDASFDRLIANHMLYHVPDIQSAVREFKRTLKPGQPLFAATNGSAHMAELHQLFKNFEPNYNFSARVVRRYSLENARQILGEVFSQVEVRIYDNNLKVTDPAALVAYVASMWDGLEGSDPHRTLEFERFVRDQFKFRGYFSITTSAGLVVARD